MRIALAILSIIAFCIDALFGFMAFAACAQMGGLNTHGPWWVLPTLAVFVLIPIVQAVLLYQGEVYRLNQAKLSACAWILGLFMTSGLVEAIVLLGGV